MSWGNVVLAPAPLFPYAALVAMLTCIRAWGNKGAGSHDKAGRLCAEVATDATVFLRNCELRYRLFFADALFTGVWALAGVAFMALPTEAVDPGHIVVEERVHQEINPP